mgnify:FL=1
MKLKGYLENAEHEIEVVPIENGYRVSIDGAVHDVDAAHVVGSFYSFLSNGRSYYVSVQESGQDGYVVWHGGFARRLRIVNPLAVATGAHAAAEGPVAVKAVMPGRVVKLLVKEGDDVKEGEPILVLEAMKMENDILAPKDGVIAEIGVVPGQAVETSEKLLVVR